MDFTNFVIQTFKESTQRRRDAKAAELFIQVVEGAALAANRLCRLDRSERSPDLQEIYFGHPALRPSGQPLAVQIVPNDLVSLRSK